MQKQNMVGLEIAGIRSFLTFEEFKNVYFSNYDLDFWLKKGFTKKDLAFFIRQMLRAQKVNYM